MRSLCIVANYNPLELPEGGPNYNKFSDDVLYQLHITHNDEQGAPNLLDYMTIDVRFKTKTTPRVAVDDKKAGPGGGKEFFAQLAGQFDQTADVVVRRADRRGREAIFERVPVAPPNIGQRTATFAYGNPSYEDLAQGYVVSGQRGHRFFAGPRDDAFYVNLAQVFDLGSFVGLNTLNGQPFRSRVFDVDPNANGTFANTDPTKAPDGLAGLNVHSIALAIPLSELAPDDDPGFLDAVEAGQPSNRTLFGVWASASRRAARVLCPPGSAGSRFCPSGTLEAGPWRQVSRIGLPLINEVVIGVQDKDKYNRTTPANDVANFGPYFLNPILVRDVEAIGGYAQLGVDPVPDDLKYGRVDILDVINLNVVPSPGAHQVQIANGRTGDVGGAREPRLWAVAARARTAARAMLRRRRGPPPGRRVRTGARRRARAGRARDRWRGRRGLCCCQRARGPGLRLGDPQPAVAAARLPQLERGARRRGRQLSLFARVRRSAPLHCSGSTPSQAGHCAVPQPNGSACGSTPDVLATYLLAGDAERSHPSCAGTCSLLSRRCQAQSSAAERIAAGESPRVGGQALAGQACRSDFDCRVGGCSRGQCGMKCNVALSANRAQGGLPALAFRRLASRAVGE